MVVFPCHVCRTSLSAEASQAGQQVRCPTCLTVLRVPSSQSAPATAALARYGAPCIVVDFGTATTFDAISRAGEYLGGIIFPGIQISADALFQRAARLRNTEIRRPEKLIGTTPTASIQSGLYYGNIALVDGLVERMVEELGPDTRVVATGGLAPLISRGSRLINSVDPDITLEGLRIIHDRSVVRSQ